MNGLPLKRCHLVVSTCENKCAFFCIRILNNCCRGTITTQNLVSGQPGCCPQHTASTPFKINHHLYLLFPIRSEKIQINVNGAYNALSILQ